MAPALQSLHRAVSTPGVCFRISECCWQFRTDWHSYDFPGCHAHVTKTVFPLGMIVVGDAERHDFERRNHSSAKTAPKQRRLSPSEMQTGIYHPVVLDTVPVARNVRLSRRPLDYINRFCTRQLFLTECTHPIQHTGVPRAAQIVPPSFRACVDVIWSCCSGPSERAQGPTALGCPDMQSTGTAQAGLAREKEPEGGRWVP